MLTELLDRIFSRSKTESSRATVRRRLQFVLAHDRADLSPAIVERMRQEILQVVARYVEIVPEESEFSLESDQRTTALIANLPIKRIRAEPAPAPPPASEMPSGDPASELTIDPIDPVEPTPNSTKPAPSTPATPEDPAPPDPGSAT